MNHSRARSIVLVLDCCHSGAFARDRVPMGTMSAAVEQRFEGRGHVVLTASTELEYVFEEAGNQASVMSPSAVSSGSLFTRYLVEGLRTGHADIDRDGQISVDDLYEYVYTRVRERAPHQTPGKEALFMDKSSSLGASNTTWSLPE